MNRGCTAEVLQDDMDIVYVEAAQRYDASRPSMESYGSLDKAILLLPLI